MRALVISGGGSKGAFGGGIAEYLIKECGIKYDLFLGTSTGSLLVPHLSIGKIDKIKELYTSVSQKDIFTICPFKTTREGEVYKSKINHWGIIQMFIRKEKTFGDTSNLRKLIRKSLSIEEFEEMKANEADVVVAVSNLSTNRVEYKLLKDCLYEDFCDWMWASSNMVPFMSLLEKNRMQYADGGMADLIPISESIHRGATEIDIIVLKTNKPRSPKQGVKNALELTTRTFDFMLNQISNDDIAIGKLQSSQQKINLNFYYPPRVLTEHSLIFDPVQMKEWWQEGFDFAKQIGPDCKCLE
ncbi:hypothetical protein GCM10007049_04050 [Echinicola pacifica]|uniref:PNPLA domain-containing protein n=1 Tax=Echinicola pacifica TaxID=346377 RepID=A0A918PLF2_9BACT|nr:patatin-like phospholipase family protein [Echinicola pacifica]GGZ15187.1 hypothetical protein GCM10007049_04050 [Echinicola pacifica]